ncbi:hypothetical protein GCM10027442_31290 [Emticicia fontis]
MFLLLTGALSFSTSAQTKPSKSVEVTGKAVAKARGANPNIKVDLPTVDNPVPKPPKSRGDLCIVKFDNWTGLYIKVYVDGYYKGILDPWDKGTVTVESGYTKIYCISTGGTREWKADGNCEGVYTYTLK